MRPAAAFLLLSLSLAARAEDSAPAPRIRQAWRALPDVAGDTLRFLVMSDDQPEEPERIAARPEFREMIREANLLAPDLLLFSWSRSYPVSLALMGFVGFGMMVQLASSNTILQTVVDDDKRGRVMSLYATSFLGMAPFGSLLMGALASQVGAPVALTVGGAGCLVGAIAFHRHLPALREHVRPIYERMGILPEIATGLQSATEPVLPAGRRAFEP